MTSDEIREQFLSFFEARGHRRLPSFPLVPADEDRSVLFTIAGMNPLKPYFLGREQPPHPRLTDCQKCFRTVDIEVVGTTARHLTFFEMLGNFSIGDYFKEGAVEAALELSLEGFGFAQDDIWVTVFEGDEELGLGPDEEAAAIWERVGIPRERIVPCPRSENWWQSGPTGPCGPCSELYLDRGVAFGRPDDRPGEENERFLEYWNLVFMQFDQDPIGTLNPLPAQHIDTGLGLNRMALIQQGVPSIFETDQFVPLMALGRELATRGTDERALRILADHSRAMTFLIGDGVVPSNEDRGYVLRRIMRRAIQQGQRIGIEPGFLPLFIDRVVETMGAAYPEVEQQRATILKWARAEEESFGRTLEQGTKLLDDLLAAGEVSGADAFRLHDTYGFPVELTRELAGERGVPFGGEDEFARLMEEQRARSRASGARGLAEVRQVAGPPTRFTGYETLAQRTTVAAIEESDGQLLVKLAESPFYAEGGGQVSDVGTLECEDGDCRARVVGVVRAGDDQALVVEAVDGTLDPGERVLAEVDRAARHATMCNHTGTHLLHAALREVLGEHVHQAGSYVGPDKLRFDFSHTSRLSPEERREVEDRVNAWVLRNDPVRPITTTLDEARSLGAMALFGEKYGDVVRMVEIGGRLLLPRALRRHARPLHGGDRRLQDPLGGVERLERPAHRGDHGPRGGPPAARGGRHPARGCGRPAHAARARGRGGRRAAGARAPGGQGGRVGGGDRPGRARGAGRPGRRRDGPHRGRAGARRPGAARPGRPREGPAGRRRGDRPGDGGRRPRAPRGERRTGARGARAARGADRQGGRAGRRWRRRRAGHHGAGRRARSGEARGGHRDGPQGDRLHPRLASVRVLGLDYGSARCGCALSDPTGTLATPIEPILRPATRKGFARLVDLVREREVARVVVGLPLGLSGADTAQTGEARAFAARLREAVDVPVELYDERFTTTIAARAGEWAGTSSEDSRAAAVLLEDWLARHGHEAPGATA